MSSDTVCKISLEIKLLKLYSKLSSSYIYINKIIESINSLIGTNIETYDSGVLLTYTHFSNRLNIDSWNPQNIKNVNNLLDYC